MGLVMYFKWNMKINSNKKKGISFKDAEKLWNDSNIYQVTIPLGKRKETVRHKIIAKSEDGNLWVAIYTKIDDGNILIRSVRLAKKKEVTIYDDENYYNAVDEVLSS